MPYHASGAATTGWTCVLTSCAPVPVPTKPAAPPPGTTTHTLEYREPGTNVDGTPLIDLAEVRAYWRVDAGPETLMVYPATALTGGGAADPEPHRAGHQRDAQRGVHGARHQR